MTSRSPFAPSDSQMRQRHSPTYHYPELPPPPPQAPMQAPPADRARLAEFARGEVRFGLLARIGFWVALGLTCIGVWLLWSHVVSPLFDAGGAG